MLRWLTGSITVGVIVFAAPAAAAPTPPEPVELVFTLPANAGTGGCDFAVLLELSGNSKTIELPSGGTIVIAPNTKVTATNVTEGSPGFGTSVEYSINGAFMNEPPDAQGNVVTKATGRNFLTDPQAGVVVTSGDFSFTTGPDGSNVVPLSGTGNVIDVCDALS